MFREIDVFYSKLLKNTNSFGKMRWNAICEDIISIYFYEFEEKERLLDHDTFWSVVFEPHVNESEKRKILETVFQIEKHRAFFMNCVYIGIDDPKDWDKWVSQFRY